MSPESIDWVFDRTGFPYLPLPGAGFAIALLPFTKAQAEFWLGDPAGPGDDWYAEVLTVSPRAGWRAALGKSTWQLVLTGIAVEEAEKFAQWLGGRLPTASEWRAGDRAISGLPAAAITALLTRIDAGVGHPAVAGLLRVLTAAGRTTSGQLALLDRGVLEWVTRPSGPAGGLGRPDPELPVKLILDPQTFDPVTLIRGGRNSAFGGRVVLPLAGAGR